MLFYALCEKVTHQAVKRAILFIYQINVKRKIVFSLRNFWYFINSFLIFFYIFIYYCLRWMYFWFFLKIQWKTILGKCMRTDIFTSTEYWNAYRKKHALGNIIKKRHIRWASIQIFNFLKKYWNFYVSKKSTWYTPIYSVQNLQAYRNIVMKFSDLTFIWLVMRNHKSIRENNKYICEFQLSSLLKLGWLALVCLYCWLGSHC